MGIYSVPSLPPGRYQVKVTASGFDPAVRTNIELQVQQTARVDFTLTVGQSSQTIEVTSRGRNAHYRQCISRDRRGRKGHYRLTAERARFLPTGITGAQCELWVYRGVDRVIAPRRHAFAGHDVALWQPANLESTILWTELKIPMSTSIRTLCFRPSTRFRSSKFKPVFTPLNSAAIWDRSTSVRNPEPTAFTGPLTSSCAMTYWMQISSISPPPPSKIALPPEPIRVYSWRSRVDPETLQREKPVVFHVQLRRLQIAPDAGGVVHHHSTEFSQWRFFFLCLCSWTPPLA